MIDTKRDIILSEGSEVVVSQVTGVPVTTLMLIGRATKQFNSAVSLEAHRRAQFLPEIDVRPGSIVDHTAFGEKYIVVGTMVEILQGMKACVAAHMFTCNAKIAVSGITETLTAKGDVKKEDTVKFTNLDCHAQASRAAMQQKDPGIFIENEYLIYAPATTPITSLDKLKLTANGMTIPLKVVDTDYFTYPGLVEIQVCSETRK